MAAAILNGLASDEGPGVTARRFLFFSDYMPAVAMRLKRADGNCRSSIFFTHDSIGVGEDGPTHQPIEHLLSLREPHRVFW
jgi:transketolase